MFQVRYFAAIVGLLLLWLTGGTIKLGLADLRYSAAEYHYDQSFKSDSNATKKSFHLEVAKDSIQSVFKYSKRESDHYHLAAMIFAEYGRLKKVENESASYFEEAEVYLRSGLRIAPTRSDIWAEYAKISLERGKLDQALSALQQSVVLGPSERSTLMVNAAVTLYSWDQLSLTQKSEGWMRLLDSMQDKKLAKEIVKIASQTGWEKQLSRALIERQVVDEE